MDTEETVEPGRRRLLRPVKGRWIAGVAAGLSRRFRIPVWIVRPLFVLLSLPYIFWFNPFYYLIEVENEFLSELAFAASLASLPFGILFPVGFGAVLYPIGWMMIPRENAPFLGGKEQKAVLPYSGRVGIYLAASLIAAWVVSPFYPVFPFLFAAAFWPSLLVLATARFHILGMATSSIVGCGLIIFLGFLNAQDNPSFMVLVINTMTVPPALLIIGLAEQWRRRRITNDQSAEETHVKKKLPLIRPVEGRWIGGAASGLSRRLGAPVWLIRTLFVLLAAGSYLPELIDWTYTKQVLAWIFAPLINPLGYSPVALPLGCGLVLYLIGWILIPPEGAAAPEGGPSGWYWYWGRAATYLATVIIAVPPGLGVPFGQAFSTAVYFWPSILVLSAARFRVPGTALTAAAGFVAVYLLFTLEPFDIRILRLWSEHLALLLALSTIAVTERLRYRSPAEASPVWDE